jgi:uncharacterized protein YndB with AHSA1/START domain
MDDIRERESDELQIQISIAGTRGSVFWRFVDGMTEWYPAAYSWSGEALNAMVIEPFLGGACYEVGPESFRCDWGRILIWEPDTRLGFSWQISPDRIPVPDARAASFVNITFVPNGTDTLLTLSHSGFDRYGTAGKGYRQMMGAPSGWPHMLGCFQTWCEGA